MPNKMIKKLKRTGLFHKLRLLFKTKEEKEMLAARVGMYKKIITAGDLVFDVGANVGNRVEAFLKIKARVVAIEPQANCRKILIAKFGNKIKIVPKGLGEKEEVKTMYISPSSTISSFAEDWIDAVKQTRFQNEEWDQTEQIELTTLEKIIEKFGIPVFIKIDVEGFELQVLKGLQTPIKKISFEYTVPEQLNRVRECIEQLNSISPKYQYNYSVGEKMELALPDYLTYIEFKQLISLPEFSKTSNGDIYVMHQ
jgi:FkbM family methyltransferase